MGLKKFNIVFDNPWATYYTGQPVSGRLLLTLDSPKKIRGIVIHFKGEADVAWNETETKTKSQNEGGGTENITVNYTSHEQYFENKFNVVGGSSGETELPAGDHSFPFTTHLPPNLPSSFEGEHGHIRYTVKAILDRPWKFDQETKAAFTVISPLDLNTHATAKDPIKKEVSKHFGFCCWKSGPFSMTLSLPVGGYVPGQDIPITVDVENNSDVIIQEVKCTLRKLLTFTVTSPSKSTKKDKITVAEIVLGSVGAHATANWTELLKVPPLPPSNLQNCSIIDLDYDLKVHTKVSGWHRNATLSTPIILGTVPLTSYQAPISAPVEKPAGEMNGDGTNVPLAVGTGWNLPPADQVPQDSLYPSQPNVGPPPSPGAPYTQPQDSLYPTQPGMPNVGPSPSPGAPYTQPPQDSMYPVQPGMPPAAPYGQPQGPGAYPGAPSQPGVPAPPGVQQQQSGGLAGQAGQAAMGAISQLYPNLPVPSFLESVFGPKNIKDSGDNQFTFGNFQFSPRYPVFNFGPK